LPPSVYSRSRNDHRHMNTAFEYGAFSMVAIVWGLNDLLWCAVVTDKNDDGIFALLRW
jgi:hypothetical protein